MRNLLLLPIATILFFQLGCAQLMGNLRKDFQDQTPPSNTTYGGIWPGQRLAEEENGQYDYAPVGHFERQGAQAYQTYDDARSWATGAQRTIAGEEDGPSVSFAEQQNMAPRMRRRYRNEDFVDSSQTEGSLWASNGQTNYFFTKNRIRGVGDIIAVEINEEFIRDVITELKKGLTEQESQVEIAIAQEKIKAQVINQWKAKKKEEAKRRPASEKKEEKEAWSTPEGEENDIEIPLATFSDIDVRPATEVQPGEKLMAEIVERYSNGNYKIRGTKRIPYRGSTRLVSIVAIARAKDINDEDKIPSGKLYEYKLKVFR